jgi:hypothetical protein
LPASPPGVPHVPALHTSVHDKHWVPLRPHASVLSDPSGTHVVPWQQPAQLPGPHTAPESTALPPWHWPFWHVPPLQSLPQVPQLLGSLCTSMHTLPQHWSPCGHCAVPVPSQPAVAPSAVVEASVPPELPPLPTGENVAVTAHVTSPHVPQKFVLLDPPSSLVPPLLEVPPDDPPLELDPTPASTGAAPASSALPPWLLGHWFTPLKFSTALSVWQSADTESVIATAALLHEHTCDSEGSNVRTVPSALAVAGTLWSFSVSQPPEPSSNGPAVRLTW